MNEPDWVEVELDNTKFKKKISKPSVSIGKIQIKFNSMFVKLLEQDGIDWYNYVNIWIDSTNKYLGFLFHNDVESPNKRKLTRQNGTLSFSSYQLVRKYSWLNEIASNPNPKNRKFEPQKKNGIYYINVCDSHVKSLI